MYYFHIATSRLISCINHAKYTDFTTSQLSSVMLYYNLYIEIKRKQNNLHACINHAKYPDFTTSLLSSVVLYYNFYIEIKRKQNNLHACSKFAHGKQEHHNYQVLWSMASGRETKLKHLIYFQFQTTVSNWLSGKGYNTYKYLLKVQDYKRAKENVPTIYVGKKHSRFSLACNLVRMKFL